MANSRPWKITTKEVLGKTVVAEDHVTVQLDIPPILSNEQTASLLSDSLKQRKFLDDGENLTRERGGVKVVIDPLQQSVTVSAEQSANLPKPSPVDESPCSCRARAKLRDSSTEEATIKNNLQRLVTERLEGAVGKLGCEMEGVVHQVTVEAIKQKAKQMGNVKRITEDTKTGSLEIVVEV